MTIIEDKAYEKGRAAYDSGQSLRDFFDDLNMLKIANASETAVVSRIAGFAEGVIADIRDVAALTR